MERAALAGRLKGRFPDVIDARGGVLLTVPREDLLETLEYLRFEPDLSFGFLSDITATDWPGREPRIWLAYQLLSIEHNHRLSVKVGLPGSEDLPHCPSITQPYPAADWFEREVYDFFGVIFDGHPDLRRIELPDEWDIYPMRKDHPLSGVKTQYKQGLFIPPPDQRGV